MNSFPDRLNAAIRARQTAALVGIDPRFDLLPAEIKESAKKRNPINSKELEISAIEEFCLLLVEIVAPLVPAVTPQAAFFEQYGPRGMHALHRVMHAARKAGLIVICDAKRGDIGSTAAAYANAYLAGSDAESAAWPADALTVNPYLGIDTLQPFVEIANARGAGLYVLVRTSNPGAGHFQDWQQNGQRLFEHVASSLQELAEQSISADQTESSLGAVVGATYPKELATLREMMPAVPFLVPGYGIQGGHATDVAAAFRADGSGALVNSSRGINFAYRREPYQQQFGEQNWQAAIEQATRDMIADLAMHTPAGLLQKK